MGMFNGATDRVSCVSVAGVPLETLPSEPPILGFWETLPIVYPIAYFFATRKHRLEEETEEQKEDVDDVSLI